jgi:FkbM family methyltransferase
MRVNQVKIGSFLLDLLKNVQNAVIFGPSILLRGVLPRDANGVVSISTRLGIISLRPSDSDMNVLRQVFVRKEYDLRKYSQITRIQRAYEEILAADGTPVIIDAGANIGSSAIFFSKMFPNAKIIAVEPDPQNADICRLNTKLFENIIVVEAAIGSVGGKVSVVKHANMSWETQTTRGELGDIRVVTIHEIMSEAGTGSTLFIAKIDIEGFEDDLFARDTSWLSDSAAIIIELHDWMFPGKYRSLPFQKAILSYNGEILISGDNLIFVR